MQLQPLLRTRFGTAAAALCIVGLTGCTNGPLARSQPGPGAAAFGRMHRPAQTQQSPGGLPSYAAQAKAQPPRASAEPQLPSQRIAPGAGSLASEGEVRPNRMAEATSKLAAAALAERAAGSSVTADATAESKTHLPPALSKHTAFNTPYDAKRELEQAERELQIEEARGLTVAATSRPTLNSDQQVRPASRDARPSEPDLIKLSHYQPGAAHAGAKRTASSDSQAFAGQTSTKTASAKVDASPTARSATSISSQYAAAVAKLGVTTSDVESTGPEKQVIYTGAAVTSSSGGAVENSFRFSSAEKQPSQLQWRTTDDEVAATPAATAPSVSITQSQASGKATANSTSAASSAGRANPLRPNG